jgi:hypothetical protein
MLHCMLGAMSHSVGGSMLRCMTGTMLRRVGHPAPAAWISGRCCWPEESRQITAQCKLARMRR